jgi:hypothetical protein
VVVYAVLILDEGGTVEELTGPALIAIQLLHGLTVVAVLFSFRRVIFLQV